MAESFEAKLTLNAAEFVRGLQDAQKQGLNLDKALDDVTASAKASAVGVADIGKASATIKTGGLDGLISKFKEGQQQSAQGGGLFGDIATKLGNLVSPAGAATAALGGLIFAVKEGIQAAGEYDKMNDKLELSFSQAGLGGELLSAQLEKTNATARALALQFAAPVEKFQELSAAAAALGGATGQTNADLTKVAFGIEKLTDGAVTGETAIKIFSRGVADPENAQALDRLVKKLPALGEALESGTTTAEKTAAALRALNPTFVTLASQAGDVGSTFDRLKLIGGTAFKELAGTIYDKLSAAFSGVADALSTINFEAIISGAKLVGGVIGDYVVTAFNVLKKVALTLWDTLKPLVDVFADLFASGSDSASSFGDIIGQVFALVGDILSGFYQIMLTLFKPAIMLIADGVKWLFSFGTSAKDTGEKTDSFADKIVGVRAVIAAVIATIREAITILGEMQVALVHLDFGKIGDLIGNFKTRVTSAFTAARDETYNTIKAQQKAEEEAAKSREELEKKGKRIVKEKEDATPLKIAEEKYKAAQAEAKQAKDAIETTATRLALQRGTALSELELLDVKRKQLAVDEELAKRAKEIFNAKEQGGKISVGIQVNAKEKATADNIAAAISDLDKNNYKVKYGLQFDKSQTPEAEIKKQLKAIGDSITLEKFVANPDAIDGLRKQLSALRINPLATDDMRDQIAVELAKVDKLSEEAELRRHEIKINLMLDGAAKDYEIKKFALDKEYQEAIKQADSIGASKVNITANYLNKLDALRKTFDDKGKAGIFDGLATAAQSALSGIGDAIADSFKEMTSAREKARKDANDIAKKETDDLEKQLAIRQITYDEYQQKIAAANRERLKDAAKEETLGSTTQKKINESLVKSFEKFAQERYNSVNAITTKAIDDGKKFAEIQDSVFTGLAAASAASFGASLAAGQNVFKALAKSIFEFARAAVNSYSAVILAKGAAELPFGLGIPAALGILALLNAALATAQALTVGFKTGRSPKSGENPNQIMGVVHGGEYVFTAQESARHSTLFDTIKRGGDVSNLFVNTKGNLTVQPNNELGGLRDELRAIKKYVARETFGKQAIAVDVRADAGYEARARKVALSRKMARS